MIDIKGFSKARVLASLYNHSHPQGMGFLHFDSKPMTEADAQKMIDEMNESAKKLSEEYSHIKPLRPLYFDYVKGRVIKVDLNDDAFDERMYDRDNFPGAAFEAVCEC